MRTDYQFTEKDLYDKYKITARSDGRYSCSLPLYDETDEQGKKHRKYITLYGEDPNQVRLLRGNYIQEKLEEQAEGAISKELLVKRMEDWLYHQKLHKIKPTSFDRLEQIYQNQILPALKDLHLDGIRLNEIEKHHIEEIMDHNLRRGYSFSVLKKAYHELNAFFKFVSDEMRKNPMAKYEFYRREAVQEIQQRLRKEKSVALEKERLGLALDDRETELRHSKLKMRSQSRQDDILVFSDEELERLKDAIHRGYHLEGEHYLSKTHYITRDIPFKQAEYFLFILNTGIRRGEALALKYSDIDYEKKTMLLSQNQVSIKERDDNGKATGKRYEYITTTKKDKGKVSLALSDCALNIIRRLQAQEPEGYDGYIVHPEKNPNRPIGCRAFSKRFENILRAAGIDHGGIHTLRHTYATKLYDRTDGDAKLVSEQLRHADVAFTQKTYIHQPDRRVREILKDFEI